MSFQDKTTRLLKQILWEIRVDKLFNVIDPAKNPNAIREQCDATREECERAAEDFISSFNRGYKEGLNE